MLINKKDVIGINKEIGCTGQFSNESSLDFALSIVKQKKSWLFELSYIARSLLVNHIFQDGNKRTVSAIIIFYLEQKNYNYNKEKITNVILSMYRKNINDIIKLENSSFRMPKKVPPFLSINKIMRLIKNVIDI